jgi:transcription factor IIIB subunit 2
LLGVKSYRRGGPGGLSKEPREVTLENGRKKIAQVAAALKMSSHYVEAAQRLFALAVTHHFIQGRRTNNVVAACLYTICRRERSPRMLPRDIACLMLSFRYAAGL